MRFKDISAVKNTLANRVNEDLMPRISKMSFTDIKTELLEIIDDPKVSIADETRRKYHMIIEKQKSLNQLQMYVYNIGMKSSGMGTF